MSSVSKLEKMLKEAEQASKNLVKPNEGEKLTDIEFNEPATFKESTKKAISMGNQLDDYHFARETLHNVLENGNKAFNRLLEVACNSDHPRAFEVVSTMMKTLGDTSKDMLSLTEQMINMSKKLNEESGGGSISQQTAGAFEGTTEELLMEIEAQAKIDAKKDEAEK